MKYTYILENLNCAHCAGRIEKQISLTKGYNNVVFSFATKQLTFEANKTNTLAEIQKICDSIEDGVTVVDTEINSPSKENMGKTLSKILLLISAIFIASAFGLHFFIDSNAVILTLSLVATVLSGYGIFAKAVKNLVHLRIDETTLLMIAVISAFILGEFVEAGMVTVLFSLGEFIEGLAVDSSRRSIQKLAKIRPDNATILINGIEKEVPAKDVTVDSTILVKPYERIPLDGVVTEGSSTLDNSALTGESLPVDVTAGNEVLSGAINGSNLLTVKTTKPFAESTATRILRLVEDATVQKSKREKLITRFASIYTPIIIAISAIIAFVPPLLGAGEFTTWIYRALVCLVASCPCAIVISVPLAYYAGIGSASKTGVLIKGGKYIDALAKTDTIAFDKTGTLTSGKLEVERVTSLSSYSEDEILMLAGACEKHSSHPIAMAIKEKSKNLKPPILENYSENAGYGTSAYYNGKKLECGGKRLLNGENIADDASVFLLEDGKLIGTITVSDTVREEAFDVISQLKKLGVSNAVMLTGDGEAAAKNVSSALNLSNYKANLLPNDKLNEVNALKGKSKAVCFVGDGINDAPVLATSDCGIAMGLGSDTAIESADTVLVSGNLSQLPKAIKIARRVVSTVRTNIIFALAVKALVITLATLGIATMWMSVIADTGVSILCVLYSARLKSKTK